MKVTKFGGSSLANAAQFLKVIDIVKADRDRKVIVVSAPGKRSPDDQKITDLLYEWQRLASLKLVGGAAEVEDVIRTRFINICGGLGLPYNAKRDLEKIAADINAGASADYAASRGEYLNAKILAIALEYEFVDATECIFFSSPEGNGQLTDGDYNILAALAGRRAVVPGFYGALPNGDIRTFSRGGSDLTGAIIARALRADTYENWTDVSGLLMADPRIVDNPRPIRQLTYRELRKLAYMGAKVFHEEAIFPVQEAGIPTNIRNTNAPDDEGTLITANGHETNSRIVTGIAGREGFTIISIEKGMMDKEIGFGRRLLTILEANGIAVGHMPGDVDEMSLIVDSRQFEGVHAKVMREINDECQPDRLEVKHGVTMIATVGQGMVHSPGVSAKLLRAVADAGINVCVLNQGSSEHSIIIGVEDEDHHDAVRAIYHAFAGDVA